MTTALIIVDVQNDFCDGGALGVNGGHRLASQISLHANRYVDYYSIVVASMDWHRADDPNGGHISDEPNFVDSWPAHCIANTHGAELSPMLDEEIVGRTVKKGYGLPSYSAFEGVDYDNFDQPLFNILTDYSVDAIDVVGIATEHCVAATALDGLIAGYKVRVLNPLHLHINVDAAYVSNYDLADKGVQSADIFTDTLF